MQYIQFMGRSKELNYLKNLKDNFFLVVKGRRRIGKTTLLRKAFSDAVYIFIWPDKSIDWIVNEICIELKIPSFKKFTDIITYLLDQNKIVIIDEFQNLNNVDKTIYGELQKLIDQRKFEKKTLKIAVAGSSYSLMNKVFNDVASPLYGRRTHELTLDHLDSLELYKELKIDLEEFIILWSVFEGVPYYFEFLDKKQTAKNNIKNLLLKEHSPLSNEGLAIISVEFGRDSKVYMTLLSGISDGKTKLNELSSLFDNKKSVVVKYLDVLRNQFGLVTKITPITEKSQNSRNGRYILEDNFLSFWFKFYDKKKYLIEQKRYAELENFFEENFSTYIGFKFEKLLLEFIKKGLFEEFKKYKILGKDWKQNFEIDILGISDTYLIGECKWQKNVNVNSILEKLNQIYETHYFDKSVEFVLFAKSFESKITSFNGRKVYCFDLQDITKLI